MKDTFVWLGMTAFIVVGLPFVMFAHWALLLFVPNGEVAVLAVFGAICGAIVIRLTVRWVTCREEHRRKTLRRKAQIENDVEAWGEIMGVSKLDSDDLGSTGKSS